ncbi:hypothetical protein Ancab_022686 [Ancistrocladus abbreviatus]
MAKFFPYNNLKRRDPDDPFSELSLSSPATKIRRLDHFLPKEEQCLKVDLSHENNVVELDIQGSRATMQPEDDCNEERALVWVNPPSAAWHKSLSSFKFPIVLNSHLIPELKRHFFPPATHDSLNLMEDESYRISSRNLESTSNLAVVPWVEYQLPSASTTSVPSKQLEVQDVEMMEAEESAAADGNNREMFKFGGLMRGGEGLQHCQQQQQHCMTRHLLQNDSNQVAWSW